MPLSSSFRYSGICCADLLIFVFSFTASESISFRHISVRSLMIPCILFVRLCDHEAPCKVVSVILLELRSLSKNFFKQDRYGAFAAEFPDRVSKIRSLVGRIRSGIFQYLQYFLQVFVKFIRKYSVFAFAMLSVIE